MDLCQMRAGGSAFVQEAYELSAAMATHSEWQGVPPGGGGNEMTGNGKGRERFLTL